MNTKLLVAVFSLAVLFGVVGLLMSLLEVEKIDSLGARDLIISNVKVEQVEVLVMKSFPVQVNLVVKGKLGDPCSMLGAIEKWREEETFYYLMRTMKPIDAKCELEEKKFEEIVEVNVEELEVGRYVVNVNGVEEGFELARDNVLTR